MIETAMVRPFWEDKPQLEDITVVICQYKTLDLIRLCIESLLTFYPTIKIIVADQSPEDVSGKWLKYKESRVRNLKVVQGDKSHGVAMHKTVTRYISTKYFLLLDSDVIFKRHGVIELMYRAINDPMITYIPREQPAPYKVFATGSLMNVTRSNYACGPPVDDTDILRYIHPSCGLFNTDMYTTMDARFVDHGAPCVYTMLEAEKNGFKVVGLPVADYVMHLSGASWVEPARPVWDNDQDVRLRPLVTFVTTLNLSFNESDYDIIRPKHSAGQYVLQTGGGSKTVENDLFAVRFVVSGDYVCVTEVAPPVEIITTLRNIATHKPTLDEIDINGFKFHKRKYFQSTVSWV